MANSSMMIRKRFIGIAVTLLTVAWGITAQINEKWEPYFLHEVALIYVNGQQVKFEAVQIPAPPWDQYKYVLSSVYVERNVYYLKDAIALYESPHPVKPYLEKIVDYFQHKLDAAKGEPCIRCEPVEICLYYVQHFNGITDEEIPSQTHGFRLHELIKSIPQFRNAPMSIKRHIMTKWMLMLRRIYALCSARLDALKKENLPNNRQEGSATNTTSNRRDSDYVSYSNETTANGDSRSGIGELPSSSPAHDMAASARIVGSLGAWTPEPALSIHGSDTSDEMYESSNANGQLHPHPDASTSSPAQHDDSSSDFSTQYDTAAEDDDPDWDEYFASFLQRLRKSPAEIPSIIETTESSDPPSGWQRFLMFLRLCRWF
ncbi:topoisomerase I, putative [Babesia ovata]|uniref:Topoisomerase I, putative n=1 Tax=Babesia ovata TaxID=189622 RepID=A0A2H6K9E4_9APIC|nr:topoisomerase I, putative [Babesia ovata]GBE59624.1 topoisomerase I, putative [Babesia ovata]